MRIMITGASGFLAHHIIKEFQEQGHYVVGVDKRPLGEHWLPNKFIQADVNDLTFRDLMGIDQVIHLAWRTNIPDCVRHPEESTRQNIDMTVHLMEVCKEAGVKKVFFPSTASLYGHNPTPWKEDMPPFPIEPYSWQKLSCEYLRFLYPNIVIGRFFQVFGELQREDTALSAFMKAKAEGRPVTLTKTVAQSTFKSGQRDFIYAGDLAKAVYLIMEKGELGEIYNVSSGKVNTMEEIAEAIGADVVWIPKREYEVERHWGSIEKLTKLGWKPSMDVLTWLKNHV